jgi:IS5 family transposase
MKQQSFAVVAEFEKFSRVTRRGEFLAQMNAVVPWAELVALVEPHYPKGEAGRPPVGLERMLRIYFLQQWFDLSDPAVEDALYDSPTMRRFVGIDLGEEPVPDETTVCKFRHLLEQHGMGKQMLTTVNGYLELHGVFSIALRAPEAALLSRFGFLAGRGAREIALAFTLVGGALLGGWTSLLRRVAADRRTGGREAIPPQ